MLNEENERTRVVDVPLNGRSWEVPTAETGTNRPRKIKSNLTKTICVQAAKIQLVSARFSLNPHPP